MTLEELGRRAVACKHWRWMEGMQVEPLRFRVVWMTDDMIGESDQVSYFWKNVPDIYPDLSDPATLGCLLALVREATRGGCAKYLSPIFMDPGWVVGIGFTAFRSSTTDLIVCSKKGAHIVEQTEAEALVAALEAAP